MLLRHARRWSLSSSQDSSLPSSLLRFFLGNYSGVSRMISSTVVSSFAQPDGGEGKVDPEEDPDGRPKKGKHVFISDAEIARPPFIYNFSGVDPDHKAARLSDAVKEKIWRAYKDNPETVTVDRLAKEYRIRKQRVQAIVWLKDIEKEEEAQAGSPLDDEIEQGFERVHGTYEAADNERHVKIRRTGPMLKKSPEEEEESSSYWDEISAKEDSMLLDEFERRMSFNKKQIAGMFQTEVRSRRRPPGGWTYVIEELGEEGKRGKRGGRRFVSEPDGTHRGLNDIEKEFLKRESGRPRRRLTPK